MRSSKQSFADEREMSLFFFFYSAVIYFFRGLANFADRFSRRHQSIKMDVIPTIMGKRGRDTHSASSSY
jgi:hypothetical protein